jgi:hypothetical protein
MRWIVLNLVFACGLTGCQATRNSLETGASTTALNGSPVIEKVDLNIKYRMEW